MLTHRAGLVIFDKVITMDIARDPDQIAKIIEEQAPLWLPSRFLRLLTNYKTGLGTKKSGYHAVTVSFFKYQKSNLNV